MPGAGKLWSVEYWELTRDALAPGGIMVQWVPQESDRDYRDDPHSFQSVFPHATAWVFGSILIGSNEPLQLDRSDARTQARRPGLAAGARQRRGDVVGVVRCRCSRPGPSEISEHATGAALLTDDRPRLEYYRTLPSDDEGWTGAALPVGTIDQLLSD